MKAFIPVLLLLAVSHAGVAAPQNATGRTIGDIDVIPATVLQRSISPKFYKTLLVSPIKGWVVVRGSLAGTRLTGLQVVHSEPNELNNHLALQRAREVQIAGNSSIEHPNAPTPALVHLLLYEVADGTLALSFAYLDNAGGNQMQYYGCARLVVLKNDGTWVDIKGPAGLEGKGLAVRQDRRNDVRASLKLESVGTGSEVTNMNTGRGRN